MDQIQLNQMKNDFLLLAAHLQQANDLAARLAVYLDHVYGPAPKGVKQRKVDAMCAELTAKRLKRLKLKVV